MNVGELEILSREDLLKIRGGKWYYDKATDKWFWIEPNSLEPESGEGL